MIEQENLHVLKPATQFGFWAAIIFAVLLIIFNITYIGIITSTIDDPWIDATAYEESFQVIEFVPQMIGFILLPTLLVLYVSIHYLASPNNRIWSLLGVIFCAGFVIVVLIIYFIEVGYVLPSLYQSEAEGLEQLIFKNPRSIAFGVNNFAWGFLLGLSLIFMANVFQGSRLAAWIRWLLVVNGIGSLLLVPGYSIDNMFLQMGAIVSWVIGLPIVMIMIAIYLIRL
jgi:hypothetical protein